MTFTRSVAAVAVARTTRTEKRPGARKVSPGIIQSRFAPVGLRMRVAEGANALSLDRINAVELPDRLVEPRPGPEQTGEAFRPGRGHELLNHDRGLGNEHVAGDGGDDDRTPLEPPGPAMFPPTFQAD